MEEDIIDVNEIASLIGNAIQSEFRAAHPNSYLAKGVTVKGNTVTISQMKYNALQVAWARDHRLSTRISVEPTFIPGTDYAAELDADGGKVAVKGTDTRKKAPKWDRAPGYTYYYTGKWVNYAENAIVFVLVGYAQSHGYKIERLQIGRKTV